MPMVIPVIAAWAGVAMTAAGTVASYFAIAGAVLTTVGAVTKKKDLMVLGGLMSFGAGLASGGTAAAAGEAGGQAAANEASIAAGSGAINGAAENVALANNSALTAAQTSDALGATTLAADLGTTAASNISPAVAYGQAGNALSTGGQALATDASSTMGAMDWLSKAGSVVKNNKELFQIGGQMLQGMFGPDAEMLDLKKQEMERRRRNANAIVPLGQLGMIGSNLGKG